MTQTSASQITRGIHWAGRWRTKTLPAASFRPISTIHALPGPKSHNPTAKESPDTQTSASHCHDDTQGDHAGGPNFPAASLLATSMGMSLPGLKPPGDQLNFDNQCSRVARTYLERLKMTSTKGPILRARTLSMWAESVNDIEELRKSLANRVRIMTTPADVKDEDGNCRGFGLKTSNPSVAMMIDYLADLEKTEQSVVKGLEKTFRLHPLKEWQSKTVGIGEKQLARFLGSVGDPYWNDLHDRPRTMQELRAYCGLHSVHGVAVARRRGEKSNWNSDARMRAWNIAKSCVKAVNSPYREVYLKTKESYADAVHRQECVRCGPSGKPAQPGSPLSKGHIDARGLRAIMKAVTDDLWRESKRLHGD